MVGVTAFVFVIILKTRVDKLIDTLKEKGVLEEDYKDNNTPLKSMQSR